MPFDALTMAAVTTEVNAFAAGGRIQRIIQPSAGSIALSIYSQGSQRWLVLSADARHARVAFAAERLAKAFATPSSFVMLLRKHLEGTRVASVSEVPGERVLSLQTGTGEHAVRLVAEVMGKHSNVILLDIDDLILGALKIVPPRLSRVRPILPGRPYQPPPPNERDAELFSSGPRLDPRAGTDELRRCLRQATARTSVSSALLGLLAGCGPLLAGQIALRAGIHPTAPLAGREIDALVAASLAFYRRYDSHDWQPCVFTDERGRVDFAPYLPLAADVKPFESMSAAIDSVSGHRESHDALASIRSAVGTDIKRAQQHVENTLISLDTGLRSAENSDAVRDAGQLVLAYQHTVAPNADRLEIPDLEANIPLNPRLTPVENAEALFRRYRKLRDAKRRIPALVVSARTERERLAELAIFAGLAQNEGDLRDIRAELTQQSKASPKAPKVARQKRGPRRYRNGAAIAIAGRNARENEEVTFHLAHREDLWFHARGRTGSHVILRHGEQPPSDRALSAVAALAAFLSEGRADTRVEVDMARVRDVRKVGGGPPGRVTYRGARTFTVAPSSEDWEVDKRS